MRGLKKTLSLICAIAMVLSTVVIGTVGVSAEKQQIVVSGNNYDATLATYLQGQDNTAPVVSHSVKATVTPVNDGGTGQRVIDGQAGWANVDMFGAWTANPEFTFELDDYITVDRVDVVQVAESANCLSISKIEVSTSTDGVTFTPVAEKTGIPALTAVNEKQLITLKFTETAAKYVKVVFTRGGYQVVVGEIGICGYVDANAENVAKFNKVMAKAEKFLSMSGFETTSQEALRIVYDSYKDTNPEAMEDTELELAMVALNTALEALKIENPVIVTGNNYTADTKTWIQAQDATAPIDSVPDKATILDDYTSGLENFTVCPVTNANDGVKGGQASHLQGKWQGGPTVLAFDLGGVQFVNRIDIVNSPNSANAKNLGEIKIEASNDLKTWEVVKTFTAPKFEDYPELDWQYQLVTASFPITEARYLRTTVACGEGTYCTRMGEIAFSGMENPAAELQRVLDKVKGILEYESYYTTSTISTLKSDYNEYKDADLSKLSIPEIQLAIETLNADIAALKLIDGQVILSGAAPNATAIGWLQANGGSRVPTTKGDNAVTFTGFNTTTPANANNGVISVDSGDMTWGEWDKNPSFIFDMGANEIVTRVDYVQCDDKNPTSAGKIASIEILASTDGETYKRVAFRDDIPEFTDTTKRECQLITFEISPVKARYIKILPVRGYHQIDTAEIFVSGYQIDPAAVTKAFPKAEYYLSEDVKGHFTEASIAALKTAYDEGKAYVADDTKWDKTLTTKYAKAIEDAITGLVSEDYLVLSGNGFNETNTNLFYGGWKEYKPLKFSDATPSYSYDLVIGSGAENVDTQDASCSRLKSGIAGGLDVWTKWGNGNPITTVWDLDGVFMVSAVDVAYNDNVSGAFTNYSCGPIKVEVSMDGEDWTVAGEGKGDNDFDKSIASDGKHVALAKVTFKPVQAKYVRISASKNTGYQIRLQEEVIYGWVYGANKAELQKTLATVIDTSFAEIADSTTYSAFTTAYTKALEVDANIDATQGEVDDATTNLKTAIANLKYNGTEYALSNNISTAKAKELYGDLEGYPIGMNYRFDVGTDEQIISADPELTHLLDNSIGYVSGERAIWSKWNDGNNPVDTIAIFDTQVAYSYIDGVDLYEGTYKDGTKAPKCGKLEVYLSNDGTNWTKAGSSTKFELDSEFESSTIDCEKRASVSFMPTKARYIKVIAKGGGRQNYCLNEVVIKGYLPDAESGDVIQITDSSVEYMDVRGETLPSIAGADMIFATLSLKNEFEDHKDAVCFAVVKQDGKIVAIEFATDDNYEDVSLDSGEEGTYTAIFAGLSELCTLDSSATVEVYVWDNFADANPLSPMNAIK